ncbi:MAG: hypothetical protein C4576_34565 [Desulfobacteraceae bacterium]|nr:MAG: hypothetical protein C4576_34565 [Desulfobacteraceae bacterium]
MILEDALLPGIQKVGELFGAGEYYLPELMISGVTMRAAVADLEPRLIEDGSQYEVGRYVIGTVQVDIHDIAAGSGTFNGECIAGVKGNRAEISLLTGLYERQLSTTLSTRLSRLRSRTQKSVETEQNYWRENCSLLFHRCPIRGHGRSHECAKTCSAGWSRNDVPDLLGTRFGDLRRNGAGRLPSQN